MTDNTHQFSALEALRMIRHWRIVKVVGRLVREEFK